MKKNLYFIAIFALCCVFLLKGSISYALVCGENYNQTNFTLSPAGIFQWNTSVCQTFALRSPTPTGLQIGGIAVSSCAPINLETIFGARVDAIYYALNVGEPCTNGSYYYLISTALYRVGGTWSLSAPPPLPVITITAPATGITITNIATNLVGNWSGINPDIYHNITFYFNSNFIGEQSVAKIIPITNWTGNFSIPLNYFGISTNGQWDLKGSATYANTQLSDMYITPDIISPVGYNLIFDIEGFHTPFTFTDFNTWYSENVLNYEAPSAWASGMMNYLQPILEKIAEFGARIQDYLDTSTAWQRGNSIGSVFPVVNAYILKINIFFGGFPIAQFFQWGILIMIGMFAIKIILKLLSFIPIIGGGG
jgi:hypothetical protein